MAEPIIEYGDLIGDDGTFDSLKANIKELKADLLDLIKVGKKVNAALNPDDTAGIQKINKELETLEKNQKDLLKVEKAMQKAKKKTIDLTNEELIQREKEKIALRERVQQAKQLAIIQREEKNSIAAIRAQLALTTLEWKKFTKEELENTQEGRKLVKNKLQLTRTLKKLEEQTGDNRRSVGKYNNALKGLRRTLQRLVIGRTIIDGIARLGGAFVDLFNDAKEGNKDFQKFSNTIGGVVNRLEGIGIAILETILPFVQAVIRRFQFFSKVISDAAGEGTVLGAIFDGLIFVVKGFINVILDIPFIFAGIKAAASAVGDSVSAQFRIMSLEAEKLKLNIQAVFSSALEALKIQQRLSQIEKEQAAALKKVIVTAGQIGDAYKDAANKARAEFAEFEKEQDELDAKLAAANKRREAAGTKNNNLTKEQNELLQEQQTLLISISINLGNRIKAIESLQKQITDSEIGSIEDRQQRLEALEEQRFKAEQAQRKTNFDLLESQIQQQDQDLLLLFEEGSDELIAFREKAEKDLFALRDLNNQVEIQQLEKHETNKLNIKKEFANQASSDEFGGPIEDAPADTQDALDAAASDKRIKAAVDANDKIKESNQKLIEDIAETASKVGEIIQELFEKQADLSEKTVDDQEGNLSRARDRAAKGLSANLAFEEKELATRQLEQQRRQKEAEQAARLLTLFNLVAAYAGSGDKNALARGLVDFSLLTALASGVGLYEGSEDIGTTSNPLDSKGGRFYKLHDNERVVPKYLNKQLAGMSNDAMVHNALLGSQMGDYFDPMSPVLTNHYQAQKEAFKQGVKQQVNGNDEVVAAINKLEQRIAKQPNVGIAIEEVYENVYMMIKKESKSNLTKISKKFLRASK